MECLRVRYFVFWFSLGAGAPLPVITRLVFALSPPRAIHAAHSTPYVQQQEVCWAVRHGFAGKHIDMQWFFLCNFLSTGSRVPFPTVSLVPLYTNVKEIWTTLLCNVTLTVYLGVCIGVRWLAFHMSLKVPSKCKQVEILQKVRSSTLTTGLSLWERRTGCLN